jgi:hypothetical protein
MKGLLDDAYELADKLRRTLDEAAAAAGEEPMFGDRAAPIQALANDADDLASRIDNQRTALRGS